MIRIENKCSDGLSIGICLTIIYAFDISLLINRCIINSCMCLNLDRPLSLKFCDTYIKKYISNWSQSNYDILYCTTYS